MPDRPGEERWNVPVARRTEKTTYESNDKNAISAVLTWNGFFVAGPLVRFLITFGPLLLRPSSPVYYDDFFFFFWLFNLFLRYGVGTGYNKTAAVIIVPLRTRTRTRVY